VAHSIRIQLDDLTFEALNCVADAGRRQRAEFVRRAIVNAIRRQEFGQMRKAYKAKPEAVPYFDSWTNWEEYQA